MQDREGDEQRGHSSNVGAPKDDKFYRNFCEKLIPFPIKYFLEMSQIYIYYQNFAANHKLDKRSMGNADSSYINYFIKKRSETRRRSDVEIKEEIEKIESKIRKNVDRIDKFFIHDHPAKVSTTLPLSENYWTDLTSDNFIVGEPDHCTASKGFLIENMLTLKQHGYNTMFVEHAFYNDQKEYDNKIEDFSMSFNFMTVWQQSLLIKKGFRNLSDLASAYNFSQLLRAAKKAGIRVIGLDIKASYCTQEKFVNTVRKNEETEKRLKYFKYTACQIMQREISEIPNGNKWFAFMGIQHVPGIANLMGGRRVCVIDSTYESVKVKTNTQYDPYDPLEDRDSKEREREDHKVDLLIAIYPGQMINLQKEIAEEQVRLASEQKARLISKIEKSIDSFISNPGKENCSTFFVFQQSERSSRDAQVMREVKKFFDARQFSTAMETCEQLKEKGSTQQDIVDAIISDLNDLIRITTRIIDIVEVNSTSDFASGSCDYSG